MALELESAAIEYHEQPIPGKISSIAGTRVLPERRIACINHREET